MFVSERDCRIAPDQSHQSESQDRWRSYTSVLVIALWAPHQTPGRDRRWVARILRLRIGVNDFEYWEKLIICREVLRKTASGLASSST